MRCGSLFACLLVVAPVLAAVADLSSAKFEYDSGVATIHSVRLEAERALAAQYTNALSVLQRRAQSDGDLDQVQAILAEKVRFEQARTAPPLPFAGGLKNLADSLALRRHDLEIAEARSILRQAQQYDAALGALQTSLTKQGRIDEAGEVKNERKALVESADVVQAKASIAGTVPVDRNRPLAVPPLSLAEMLTSPEYEWTKPENLGPDINSKDDEWSVDVSSNGLVLVFDSSRNQKVSSADLFMSDRTNLTQPFGKAAAIAELNSTVSDGTPCLNAEGTALFFYRTAKRNDSDLFTSRRRNRTATWESPGNLGPACNSGALDSHPCLSDDGLVLFFGSNREGGRGGGDLWRMRRKTVDDPWEAPENLGEGINTAGEEGAPDLAGDQRTLLFRRDERVFVAAPDAKGDLVVQLLEIPVTGKLGSARIMPDGRTLYFTSNCAGGEGGWDIWMTRRVPKPKRGVGN